MKCSELIRKLEQDGWYSIRQKGSHIMMIHPTKQGQLTVPNHGSKEVPKGLAIRIMKDAGIK
ncbi:MAG: type II toxin-antitoxin system HicA family toxin [Microscillaceae bacterium]|jgi:predicted RNA binding protein YcfA (HicA-like mRNA interferase family)|nr:type II toxin-antitoxin system HicA family toxin [Microscillaceae bacterium]